MCGQLAPGTPTAATPVVCPLGPIWQPRRGRLSLAVEHGILENCANKPRNHQESAVPWPPYPE